MSLAEQPLPDQHPAAGPPAPPAPLAYYPYPVPAPQRGRASVLTILAVALLGLLVAIGATLLLVVAATLGAGGRTVGELGQRASDTARSAGDAVARAGQEARDRFDPNHPPRDALAYDAEIDDFVKLGVGQALPVGRARTFSVARIELRPDGELPTTSRFVVIHSELRQPNETKVLGVTVRRDSEPRDYPVYQGEGFRIGGQVYKVNWISPERQQVALVALRDPDRATLPLKFSADP